MSSKYFIAGSVLTVFVILQIFLVSPSTAVAVPVTHSLLPAADLPIDSSVETLGSDMGNGQSERGSGGTVTSKCQKSGQSCYGSGGKNPCGLNCKCGITSPSIITPGTGFGYCRDA